MPAACNYKPGKRRAAGARALDTRGTSPPLNVAHAREVPASPRLKIRRPVCRYTALLPFGSGACAFVCSALSASTEHPNAVD